MFGISFAHVNMVVLLARLSFKAKYTTSFNNKELFMKSNCIVLSKQLFYKNLCSYNKDMLGLRCKFSIKFRSSLYFLMPSNSFPRYYMLSKATIRLSLIEYG